MSLNSPKASANGRLARGTLVIGLLALWFGVALVVGLGQTVFFAGAVALGGGYLLLRLVRAVERLAVAADRLAERRE